MGERDRRRGDGATMDGLGARRETRCERSERGWRCTAAAHLGDSPEQIGRALVADLISDAHVVGRFRVQAGPTPAQHGGRAVDAELPHAAVPCPSWR